jgi:hypothetical protein
MAIRRLKPAVRCTENAESMGIDTLDITFRLERAFAIKLP